MDEYMMQQLKEFDGKKFICLSKDNEEFQNKEEDLVKSYENILKFIKECLGDKIEKVTLSQRLSDSPCCLITDQYGWSSNMERIMKAQPLKNNGMSFMMGSKKIMEINPDHKIIKSLRQKIEEDKDDKTAKDLIHLLFSTSLLNSGFSLNDPAEYTKKIHRIIELGLNVPDDENDGNNNDKDNSGSNSSDGENDAEEEDSKMEQVD